MSDTNLTIERDEIEPGAVVETVIKGGIAEDDTTKAGVVKRVETEYNHAIESEQTFVVLTDGDDERRVSLSYFENDHDQIRITEYHASDEDESDEVDRGDGVATDGGTETDIPPADYDGETTADYRQADAEQLDGDGHYVTDYDADSLTEGIAAVATRHGGRIPEDFSADVEDEGYARERTWTIYAPAPNPYLVASTVTEWLLEQDVGEVDVRVEDRTAADAADVLRATNVAGVADDAETEAYIEALRYQAAGADMPEVYTTVEDRLLAMDEDTPARGQVTAAANHLMRHPGDAWDYHRITVALHEQADGGYYG